MIKTTAVIPTLGRFVRRLLSLDWSYLLRLHRLAAWRRYLFNRVRVLWCAYLQRQESIDRPAPGRVVVVIPVYSRPANLKYILRPLLRCRWIDAIVVSNSNRSIRIRDHVPFDDPRLNLIDEPERFGVGIRWIRCADHEADYYLSIDDDIFMPAESAWSLIDHLARNPAAPLGCFGSRLHGGREYHVDVRDREVDILYGTFAFTSEHLSTCLARQQQLDLDYRHLNNGEDLCLSQSGTALPYIVPTGFFHVRDGMRQVAIHKTQSDFLEFRADLYRRHRAAGLLARQRVRLDKLNLGCGTEILPGYLNVDRAALEGVDAILDVGREVLPFEDGSFSEIKAFDILEHVPELARTMAELHRVLTPGGVLRVRVPHFTSPNTHADPTHRRGFSVDTLKFFSRSSGRSYYFGFAFARVLCTRIVFRSRHRLYHLVEWWVNLSEKRRFRYEIGLLRAFPATNVICDLEK